MGLRHLRGLRAAGADVTAVDPRPDPAVPDDVPVLRTIDEALAAGRYDAAVMAETAAGRLPRFTALAEAGVRRLLVEKPLEQSRERVHALAAVARTHGVDARVNHFFRTLPLFQTMRLGGEPFHLSVTGGAFGLACNGIHWLDLALFLSGDGPATLLFGELDDTLIESGRGSQFRDFGGRALYGLANGSRLYLASAATSSAPMHAVIEQPARQTVISPHDEQAWISSREPDAEQLPTYRYGAGYRGTRISALEADDLWRATEYWARATGGQPELDLSVRAHDLLFDLLELGGDDSFPIT
jgi:hypothetical protein